MSKSAEEFIQSLDLTSRPKENAALNKLRSICASLQKRLSDYAGGGLAVHLVPGYRVNMGQEYKLVITLLNRNYRETLFRAYTSAEGYPIKFDFYGENVQSCASEAEADAAIADFFSRSEVIDRLRQYVELVKEPA